ncbi:carnosine synthase 1 isoform X1 [Ornithorhynchus anatinus]|uniref:carnosine synthase 1 isoform X1 n=2 Tax=Ornithorhynchus anatinus TaxID=9258 RepID=UPI0010A94468|nr:carnosine synthase 1 isoform X1 [Ornithorhynchus anatinus]XP_028916840.1 carnosine synthase 1 isoform X1 [Ornithorhynchus anatinus]
MLSLEHMGPDWELPGGSKDQEEEREGAGEQGGGDGLPPPSSLWGSWRRDVNLDCKGAPEGEADRAWTTYYYDLLQSCLQQAGLPETADHTARPQQGCPGAEVTLCVLGSPSSFLSVLLEGGTQSPGNMLLCLSPAWLAKAPLAGRPGESSLLVAKAVAFHRGGLTVLQEFAPPRRATYFLANWGLGAGSGREAGELARGLACPTGGSAELARLLEDRLLTRLLLARGGGLTVPPTLAFAYKPSAPLQAPAGVPGLRVVELSGKEGQEGRVREEVEAFLQSGALGAACQVAVKPSGWRWRGARALSLHPRGEPTPVVRAVLLLLERLEEEESVLVEAVCPPARPLRPAGPEDPDPAAGRSRPDPDLALRICTVVCRTQGDRPLLSQVVCGVGRADRPLRHQVTLPQTLELALAQCGLSEPGVADALRRQLAAAAEAALSAVLDMESTLTSEQRGGPHAQTDFICADFALTAVGQRLTLAALELNGCLCLEACGVLEGPQAGPGAEGAAGPLVETMLRRSARCLMEGKHLLIIGAGGVGKKFVWEAARDYGLKLHLVESDPNHFASQLVQTFLHFDVTEHRHDEEHARQLAELVRARGLRLDGCLSYWDDCLVLTALLCQELGLRCSPPAAMRLAKQKSRTQLHLLRCRGPRWPGPALYAVPCCPLQSPADVERAARLVPLPGVMKLEFGAGAVGVRLVEDGPQCQAHFGKIARDLRGEADHPGIGLGWGNAMLLMEYVAGTEHDVDLILFGGRLLGAFVSDNGPTRLPGFTETAARMPTGLAPEQEAQLVRAAHQCCLGCGLLDGVFNVELKLTATGPRLLEINPRMGGFYLRDWIQELYGVDLFLAAAMVACGLAPALPARPRARAHLVGVMCVVSQHLQALRTAASREALQALQARGLIRLNLLEEELVPGEYEEPYCSLACAGASAHEARQRLLGLCQGLGIDSPDYPVAHFLSHFK